MVIYSHFLFFSRCWGSWQRWSTFVLHPDGTLCLWSPRAMVSMLAISRWLCGHCFRHWVLVSPHSLSAPRGYFVGTRTSGMCAWSSMRDLWPIIFIASAKWSRLPHRGGRSREAWEMLSRGFGHSTTWRGWPNGAFIVPPLPEPRPTRSWSCGYARWISRPHWVFHRPSEADSCIGSRSWWGHQGGQTIGRA
jgi:hypothetical protein